MSICMITVSRPENKVPRVLLVIIDLWCLWVRIRTFLTISITFWSYIVVESLKYLESYSMLVWLNNTWCMKGDTFWNNCSTEPNYLGRKH